MRVISTFFFATVCYAVSLANTSAVPAVTELAQFRRSSRANLAQFRKSGRANLVQFRKSGRANLAQFRKSGRANLVQFRKSGRANLLTQMSEKNKERIDKEIADIGKNPPS